MKLISRKIVDNQKVYDLHIQSNHTYLITKSDILVHNSGKGFVKSNLLGIDGWTYDVDALKEFAVDSAIFSKRIKEEQGIDIKKLDFKNPEDVSLLHLTLANKYNLDKNHKSTILRSVMNADQRRKPNLIFDVTLKDLRKLQNVTKACIDVGYDTKDIHIVWVVNDIQVALKQNEERKRTVAKEILINTHEGVQITMKSILNMGDSLKKYMDGDIVFVFNKVGVDSEYIKSKQGGAYIKEANYVYIKKVGKGSLSTNQLSDEIRNKISKYTPPTGFKWE